ncbi:MAG: HypC/HybG/HupF family hydrogenase formation chaperone [Cyanobacteria bacterium]|nr:HypC/HybG/HupF family hydrogenase formation chaperone [Cyanobacteriota bacterium]
MCVSVPAKVIALDGKQADVLSFARKRSVFLACDQVKEGDWVLLYGNLALRVLSESEADEMLELLDQLSAPATHPKG